MSDPTPDVVFDLYGQFAVRLSGAGHDDVASVQQAIGMPILRPRRTADIEVRITDHICAGALENWRRVGDFWFSRDGRMIRIDPTRQAVAQLILDAAGMPTELAFLRGRVDVRY